MTNSLPDSSAPLQSLYDFIVALAGWRSELIDIAVQHRADPMCESVRTGIDIRAYQPQLIIELFVDAELASGSGLTFWIDIVPSVVGAWHVTSSIKRMEGVDQVPVRTIEDLDVGSLPELTEVLRNSLDVFARTDLSIAL
jgi:hypothetical protein